MIGLENKLHIVLMGPAIVDVKLSGDLSPRGQIIPDSKAVLVISCCISTGREVSKIDLEITCNTRTAEDRRFVESLRNPLSRVTQLRGDKRGIVGEFEGVTRTREGDNQSEVQTFRVASVVDPSTADGRPNFRIIPFVGPPVVNNNPFGQSLN